MSTNLRNIGLIAHGGAGKTSLAEAILFKSGVITRQGRVEEGNTAMDFEPEEIKRQSSMGTSFHQYPWKKHEIYIMDTPGDQNFFADTRSCLQGADACVVVIDAVDGVKVQTQQAWDLAEELLLPKVIFINKLDRERSDFQRTVDDAAASFESKLLLLQLPIGKEDGFQGVVDILNKKAYIYENGQAKQTDIPADLADKVESEHEALIENVAEADDKLLERYLEGESLSNEEIHKALRIGTINRTFTPVLCGCATKNIGVDLLMDFVNECMPAPEDCPARKGINPVSKEAIVREPKADAPFSGLVIKTISDPYAGRLNVLRVFSGKLSADSFFYNASTQTKERFGYLLQLRGKEQKQLPQVGPGAIVAVAKLKETSTGHSLCDESAKMIFDTVAIPNPLISFAVVPVSRGDEEKIIGALARLVEEDQSLKVDRNQDTKDILLSGMGQIHIESAVDKMKRKYNVNVTLKTPKVPYRETLKKKVRVQGRHKKQTGGHGQFGDCWVVFEPLERGAGFEFVDAIVGGVVPKTYIPAVEKGIIEASARGALAGFPTVDFRATLDFGSYHTVDSSEMAFKIAGSLAYKKAMEEAQPTLLEPIMKIAITVPEDCTGDIMGDLNSRRGRVLGMDSKGKNQIVEAHVPMAEILTYAPDLNSMTGGRGVYTMEFSHYDEVPSHLASKVIEAAKAEEE